MVTVYSIFRKVQRSLDSSNFSQSLYSELTQTFISRLFFSTVIPSWCSDHGLSVPRLSTLLGQLLPLHLSRPELQLFIASELKKFVIPARKEQTDRSFRFRFSVRCGSFVFRVGKRRDNQLHQLHVNLYQFYYFIWLLLVTKKQSISNRPLWPSFSAPFLSLIYPWVFSAGFLYRGYSATCRAPGSTSWLMTPQNLLIFLT